MRRQSRDHGVAVHRLIGGGKADRVRGPLWGEVGIIQ